MNHARTPAYLWILLLASVVLFAGGVGDEPAATDRAFLIAGTVCFIACLLLCWLSYRRTHPSPTENTQTPNAKPLPLAFLAILGGVGGCAVWAISAWRSSRSKGDNS